MFWCVLYMYIYIYSWMFCAFLWCVVGGYGNVPWACSHGWFQFMSQIWCAQCADRKKSIHTGTIDAVWHSLKSWVPRDVKTTPFCRVFKFWIAVSLRFLASFSIFFLWNRCSRALFPVRWDVVEYLSVMFHWSVKLDSDVPVIYSVGIRWICCSPTVLVFCKGTDCWLPPALDGNQCIDRSDLSCGQTMKYSFAHVPWTQESFQSSRWCWRSPQGGFAPSTFLTKDCLRNTLVFLSF